MRASCRLLYGARPSELAYYGAKVLHPRTLDPAALGRKILRSVRSPHPATAPARASSGDAKPGAIP